MISFQLNYLAVIVGIVINMAVGALWYSPVLFGNIWLKAKGLTKDDINDAGKAMLIALFAAILSTLALALMIKGLGVQTIAGALISALVIFIGFTLGNGLLEVAFEDKKVSVFIINLGNMLTVLIINSILFVLWQ